MDGTGTLVGLLTDPNSIINYVNDNFDSLMTEASRIIALCKEYMGR